MQDLTITKELAVIKVLTVTINLVRDLTSLTDFLNLEEEPINFVGISLEFYLHQQELA